MHAMRQMQYLDQRIVQRRELSQSVRREVRSHWDEKISRGLILANEKDLTHHAEDMDRFAAFETRVIAALLQNEWKLLGHKRFRKLHYFGIGTGNSLEQVVKIANASHYEVVAYDVSVVGVDRAETIFKRSTLPAGKENEAVWADIFTACQKRYIAPRDGTRIVLPRILDVLDSQEPGWEQKEPDARKTPSTARRIGTLLSFAEALLIHACPEENPDVERGDSRPYTLEAIARYVREGLGAPVEMRCQGKIDCFGYRYTAVLLKRKTT